MNMSFTKPYLVLHKTIFKIINLYIYIYITIQKSFNWIHFIQRECFSLYICKITSNLPSYVHVESKHIFYFRVGLFNWQLKMHQLYILFVKLSLNHLILLK